MKEYLKIDQFEIGSGMPCFIIGEIGINHNGDIDIAKKLIDVASFAGCQAVKFQKRTPELCVPEEQKKIMRETPWGIMTYLEYKKIIEFSVDQYKELTEYCKSKNILWSASCWDTNSLSEIVSLKPTFLKIASPSIINIDLVKSYRDTGLPLVISTGMSTLEELDQVASILGDDCSWMFLHTCSSYPAPHDEINLKVINMLRDRYNRPVGYSGHEKGLQVSIAAVAIGANFIERHITLDRTMWGTDQASSLEPAGIIKLIRDIRIIEESLGCEEKKVQDSEISIKKKLRGK